MARARDALAAAGLAVVPLTVDQGPELGRARRVLDELGWVKHAGAADGKTLRAWEVLLAEVFHRTDNTPLPSSLLLDRRGQLCVVYHGPVQVADLLADVEVLATMKPARGSCAAMSGGVWVERPRRAFGPLAGILNQLAYPEQAAFYRELAGRRH
jgi:hypothetical protein